MTKVKDSWEFYKDRGISDRWKAAPAVKVLGHEYTKVGDLEVGIPGLHWLVPMWRVLETIGLKPEELVLEGASTTLRMGYPADFGQMAKVFGKPVQFFREDGSAGERWHMFTVHPDGRVEYPAK